MWRRNAVLLTLCLGVTASARGQQTDAPSDSLGSLCSNTQWARFEIVLGRIKIYDARYGKKRQTCRGDLTKGEGEVLRLQVADGVTCLHFERQNAEHRVTFDFVGDNVTLMREPKPSSGIAAVRYEQSKRGDVALFVADEDSERQFRAASLWHLWLSEPQVCQRELAPLLRIMRPNWDLSAQWRRIEQQLFDDFEQMGDPNRREKYRDLVDQLADNNFLKRQQAYEKLRRSGVEALSFLGSLDPTTLDSEQRIRIRKLREAVRFQRGDSPDRVASWMRDDRAVWFAYLASSHPERRRSAHQQLCDLCGRKLEFDPSGDTQERAEQLNRLAARIAH